MVPVGATTGKVSVTVGPNTGVSTDDFTICDGIELQLSNLYNINISANRSSFTFNFNVVNYGAVTAPNFTVHAYLSTDNIYNNGDELDAGIYNFSSVNPGETYTYYTGVSSSVSGGTVDDHPYLIVVLSTTSSECDNTIGHMKITKIIP